MTKTTFLSAFLGALLILFGAGNPVAQSAKELAVKSSGDMRLLITFGRMERSISDIDHLLTHGIVASAGGWDLVDSTNSSEFNNVDLIRTKAAEVQGLADRSNSTIQRSKASTDFQKARSADIIENIEKMLVAVLKILDALAAEDLSLARDLYRGDYQKPYEEALRIARSSTTELEKSLSGTLFRLSVAK